MKAGDAKQRTPASDVVQIAPRERTKVKDFQSL